MRINAGMIQQIDWTDHRGTKQYGTIQEKLIKKHFVYPDEVEDAFLFGSNPVGYQKIGPVDDPKIDGIRGLFFGKVEHARYLIMIAIVKPDGQAIVLSAREMTSKQSSFYQREVSRQSKRRLL
jgi:hypothetical protein